MKYLIGKIGYYYDFWINDSYKIKPEYQSIFRIIYCLFVLLILGIPDWTWLSYLSDSFFDPPKYSVSAVFHGFPKSYFFIMTGILLNIAYVLLLFGYKTKFVSILVSVIYIIGNSFYYSRGKINHTDLLIVITPLIMAFSSWGYYYSIDSINNKNKKLEPIFWPVSLLALIIGYAYFTAGLPKLLGGWLITNTHAVKGILFNYYYTNEYQNYLSPYLIEINNDLFWELFDYTAVLFETTFLIAVFYPLFFRFYIFLAVLFHLLNYLIINIPFVENFVVYSLFMNFSIFNFKKFKTIKIKFLSFFESKLNLAIILIAQILIYLKSTISPFQFILKKMNSPDYNIILLTIGFIIAMINILHYLENRVLKKKSLI